jgi:hypothetical protein
VLSIQALEIRFFVGVRAIRPNHCGRMDRGVQGIALWAGLFLPWMARPACGSLQGPWRLPVLQRSPHGQDDRDIFQGRIDKLPAIDIHSL